MILFRSVLSGGASRLLVRVGGPVALRIFGAFLLLATSCWPRRLRLVILRF
uniref:Uncharacterized protein n=1 Tax=Physcomitrium patens TaxID=3218 RepID=A0A2K1JS26_PHYPA|nr:hypothetical protein PHYPA_016714 [Physcomitrium patens]